MTIEKAETILSMPIKVHHDSIGGLCVIAYLDRQHLRAYATGANLHGELSAALDDLIQNAYHRRQHEVGERQKWRCFQCGKIKPLQLHHIHPRSKGRFDHPSNLVGVCYQCHASQHGRKQRDFQAEG